MLESAATDFAALWPAVKAEAKVGVKPLAYPLLTDENIHPKVALELRRQGKDVVTAIELGLGGRPDTAVLVRATEEGRDGSSGHRTAARL